MKKYITIVLVCFSSYVFSQANKADVDYNRWSFEVNVGQNKAVKPFAPGYFSSNPSKSVNFSGFNHYDLGVRYMLSNAFGLKLDYGFDKFTNQSGAGSLPFHTKQNRFGFQGVMNLGRLMHFEMFTERLGLLTHFGLHLSQFSVKEGINVDAIEANAGLMFGITPQVRLSKRLVLTADFTVVNNVRQHLNWDGSVAVTSDNLSGVLYNSSIGLTYYFGKQNKHADWYVSESAIDKGNAEAIKRIEAIENQMNDTDRDGIVDYLDAENNTPSGVAVDSKGRFYDTNKNGTPDEMEKSTEDVQHLLLHSEKVLAVENDLVEKGLVNLFFDVNSTIPNEGSSNSLYIILNYLQKNPTSKVKLYGFADKRGDEVLNKNLSSQRAKKVFDFLVSNAIPASRVSIEGVGSDTNFIDNSVTSLTLSRRVSLQIVE